MHMAIALSVMLVVVGYYLWREHAAAGAFGFPLDDSWVHAQVARNAAIGEGYSINPGEVVPVTASPLWTLVCASGYLMLGNSVLAAKLAGVLLLAACVYLAYELVRVLTNDIREALFAAVVVGSLPRLVWGAVSGMEVTLAAALVLGGVLTHVLYNRPGDRRQYLSTLLLGLAALARPECSVVFAAAMIDRLLSAVLVRWTDIAARDWLLPVMTHVLVFLAVLTPALLFNARFGYGLMPNPAYAKAFHWNAGLLAAVGSGSLKELARAFTIRPCDYLVSFLQESLRNNAVLFLLVGFGVARLTFHAPYSPGSRYRSFILPLTLLFFPLSLGVVMPFGGAGYQEARYVTPVAPLVIVTGVFGLYAGARYAARILSEAKFMGEPARIAVERGLVWFLMVLALGMEFRDVWYRGKVHGREVANIECMQVSIGRWADKHLPAGAVVATNDIGAISYFGRRKLIDTVGLLSPDVLSDIRDGASRDEAVGRLLRRTRPDYAVLFPSWYPGLVRDASLLREVHGVTLKDNVMSGGEELVVYRVLTSHRSVRPVGERGGAPSGQGASG